jgi:disulfide bond formation protein DsbB
MKTTKPVLLAVTLVSLSLLLVALYLQYGEHMQPCPLCVIQRYAFFMVALICIIALGLPRTMHKAAAGLAGLIALAGAGVAGWHLYSTAHPNSSCGIDPLETALNKLPTADLLSFLFKADGLCATPYPPIFGLSIPQWSLIWFVVLGFALLHSAFRRGR